MYRLVFLEGPDKGRRVVIRQAAAEAGRDPDVRIPLDDPVASEHHAVFIRNHGEVHVETGMGAGPFMRHGKPLGREPLRHGDVLELGGLRLQFQKMEPLIFHTTRRPSRTHLLTMAASLLVVTGQVVFLGLIILRGYETPLPVKEAPAEETTAAVATPPEPLVPRVLLPETPLPEVSPEKEPVPEKVVETRPAVDDVVEKPAATVPAATVPAVVDPPAVVAPTVEEAKDLSRRIRITDVAREKFQEREGYEEVRAARVILHPKRSLGEIDPSDVRVEVIFYDRDVKSDEVAPTRVPLPEQSMDFGEQWAPGEEKSFIAVYGVPEGFRAGEQAGHGERRAYYGYVVQLYYRGDLEDVYAFPSSLLE